MAYEENYKEYEKFKHSQQNPLKRFVKNIEVKHIILIIFLIGFFVVIFMKQEKIDKTYVLIFGGLMIGLVILLMAKSSVARKLVTEPQAKLIVERELNAKIGVEDWIPNGSQIILTGYCALIKFGDSYSKWEIGVKVINQDGKIDERMIAVHPYEGFIMKIRAAPTGYDATESPDIQPMFTQEYYAPKEKEFAEGV